MFSQKSQLIIISSLIAFVLISISSALGTNEPMSERAPPISCEDLTVESNLVRQECLPVDDTDTLDCSFYFDAKKHSLLNDPATCLIFGYVRIPPSSLDHVCWSKLSTNACIQNDTSWLRVCFEIYYAGTFMLDHRNSTMVDNLKIGSYQVSSADFVDVGILLTKAINGCSGLVGFPR